MLAVQSLNARELSPKLWQAEVNSQLSQNREWLRVERRDIQGGLLSFIDSPLREPIFDAKSRLNEQAEIVQTCLRSKRLNGPAFSRSYFVPQVNGMGLEVMELCLPMLEQGGPLASP